MLEEAALRREARRVLPRLCETGAVLAVAHGMENAVVVRDVAGGETLRTATVAQTFAQAMALKDWIQSSGAGRVLRYSITAAGRAALNRMLAEEENVAQGFAEAQGGFEPAPNVVGPTDPETGAQLGRGRFNSAESPLVALARRRDKKGTPFLETSLVSAGERLREDFELAQMGARDQKSWVGFLEGAGRSQYRVCCDGDTIETARQRVSDALCALGDGLGDVALRCCCYLEGLETIERHLGWSARSAKIVLRIALGRFREHYASHAGGSGDYIG